MSEVDSRLERILNGEDVEPLSVIEALIKQKMSGGGGGGVSNYPQLQNLPRINGVELKGNKLPSELGLLTTGMLEDALRNINNTGGFIRFGITCVDVNDLTQGFVWMQGDEDISQGSYDNLLAAYESGKRIEIYADSSEGADHQWLGDWFKAFTNIKPYYSSWLGADSPSFVVSDLMVDGNVHKLKYIELIFLSNNTIRYSEMFLS